MSISYVVTPLLDDEAFANWLDTFGILPPTGVASRFPTIREIRCILENLDGFDFETWIGGTFWDADIFECHRSDDRWEGEYTRLCVINYEDSEEIPVAFYFHKGSARLALFILQRLTQICGPLVIVLDTCGIPILVTPKTDIDRAHNAWDS